MKELKPNKSFQTGFWILLLLSGAAGFGLILYCTRWGAGLMDDAFIYISSAKNLVAGKGLSWPSGNGQLVPLTHFPPLFPLLLAAWQSVGIDAMTAARWVNAFLFGVTIVVIGIIIWEGTHSTGFALAGSLLILVSDVFIDVHSWAMSEPLYICLQLSGLLFLGVYFKKSQRVWLLLSAISLGLAFLTRYIGAALLLTAVCALILISKETWRRRFSDTIWFGAISLIPMIIFLTRNFLTTGGPTDRYAYQHLITLKQVTRSINTILLWFIPGRLVNGNEWILLILLCVLITLTVVILRKKIPGLTQDPQSLPTTPLSGIIILQIAFYLIVLFISKSYFDPITPLNDRILSPILPSLLIIVLIYFSRMWKTGVTWLRVGVLGATLIFAGFYLFRAADTVPRMHNIGIGLARKGWHNSPTLQAIRQLPQVPIFSNSPAALYFWTNRPAYSISNPTLMRESMRKDQARLVIFNSVSLDLYDVTLDELTQGLTRTQDFKDGAIYQSGP